MERLTGIATTETNGIYKGKSAHVEKNTAYLKNTAFTINDLSGNATMIVQKAINLLAKFEDIGETPEKLADISAREDNVQEALERMEETLENDKNTISELRAQLEMYRGFDGCRLHQIIDADMDGRLVILPCKVGDAVRGDVYRPYNGHTATIHGEVSDVQAVVRVKHSSCRYVNFLASDFGKSVFHEQAKGAWSK